MLDAGQRVMLGLHTIQVSSASYFHPWLHIYAYIISRILCSLLGLVVRLRGMSQTKICFLLTKCTLLESPRLHDANGIIILADGQYCKARERSLSVRQVVNKGVPTEL
jgi:hypothetical protein